MATRRLPLSAVVVATAVALVAAIGVLALFGDDDDSAAEQSAEGYELSPAGELPTSLGEVRLAALDGGDDRMLGELVGTTPVVVNFFGSWCVPCIEEMPALERVHRDVGDRVTFVGMAVRDTPELARDTVDDTGVTYPTYNDPDSNALTFFGGLGMPTTVFIDAAGEVVDVNSGPLTEDQIRAKLADLFGVAA